MILNNPKIKWAARNYLATDLGPRKPLGSKSVLELENKEKIYYYCSGSGPIIVLSASMGRSVSDFNELVYALNKKKFKTIAVESRGIEIKKKESNLSDLTLNDLASDIEKVLLDAKISSDQRISLIGHAFGNRVVRCFASMLPKKVNSLILIAAGGRNKLPKSLAESLWFSMFTDTSIKEQTRHLRVVSFAQNSIIPNHWYYGWNRFLGERQIQASRATDKSKWWDSGNRPILLFQGLEDPIAPPEHASKILKKSYHGSLMVIDLPEVSHALLPEADEEISSRTIEYLQKIKLELVKTVC